MSRHLTIGRGRDGDVEEVDEEPVAAAKPSKRLLFDVFWTETLDFTFEASITATAVAAVATLDMIFQQSIYLSKEYVSL